MLRALLLSLFVGVSSLATVGTALTLKPTIGLSQLPDTSAKICALDITPMYSSFEKTGLHLHDTIPDFTLYTLDGKAVTASAVLAKGKPMLLVAGSYTCGIFRRRIADLNTIYSKHSGDISIYVIYTIEAHPIIDNSPYSASVWVPKENYDDSVLYRQPTSYGERRTLATAMLAHLNVNAPIVVDGPCNEWWKTYGPAPNNAYLIDTLGRVYSKHGWFNDGPHDMEGDIDSLLKGVEPAYQGFTSSGAFTVAMKSDSAEGMIKDILADSVTLSNPTYQPVTISITRSLNRLPTGWSSAMCTDICYGSGMDMIQQYLTPRESVTFALDVTTSNYPGTGVVTIDFVNADSSANRSTITFYATAYAPVKLKPFIGLSVLPNTNDRICATTKITKPVDSVGLKIGDTIPDFTLFDSQGKAMNAASMLGRHKPMLLVAGSFSSPEFREQLWELNATYGAHAKDVSIYVVYVVEPHPIVDKSPYTDSVWVPSQNYTDDVLFRQPTIYGERVDLVQAMLQRLRVSPSVLLDGACNTWWNTFGPAPNNAYLIDTSGRVYAKHIWFDRAPREMDGDIDSLFKGVKPGYKVNGTTPDTRHGAFTFAIDRDTARGNIDTVFTARAVLTNPTPYPVVVAMTRTTNILPPKWTSSMGSDDAWYPPAQNTIYQYLAPHTSNHLVLDFNASNVPGAASVTIQFSNSDSAQNTVTHTFCGVATVAGVQLHSSIGLNTLPQSSEAICSIANVRAAPTITGLHVGDVIPDFTLFTLNGVPVNASAILASHRPLLLVAGSYSSPEFRASWPRLKALSAARGTKVEMYIVYVAEPHPIVDASPYADGPWVTNQNYQDTVLLRQPRTYGERSATAMLMYDRMNITVPIILDGPCNEWWNTFGPAPNNAYLINTDGRVYAKHAWFDAAPRDMKADIDSLLKGVPSGYDTIGVPRAGHGIVTYAMHADTVKGTAGHTLADGGTLFNTAAAPVVVHIVRHINNLPADWTCAMATDIFYGANVDTTSVFLASGDSVHFTLEFNASMIPGSASVSVEFINEDSTANTISRTFWAITEEPSGVSTPFPNDAMVTAYPQPVAKGEPLYVRAETAGRTTCCTLRDVLGRVVCSTVIAGESISVLPTTGLTPGAYFLSSIDASGRERFCSVLVR